jgi:hypothetical protein
MKGRKSRATGGVNQSEDDLKSKPMRYTAKSNVNDEAEERKSGGKVPGKMAKAHAGRAPRKSGGRAGGSNSNPFSSARAGTPAPGRKLQPETMG